jgi:hypothetical protein
MNNPSGIFAWTVPSGAASTNCYVRVAWKSNTAINDVSDAAFTIHQPTTTDTTLAIPVLSGWNIVSSPLTNPIPGDSLRQLFPHAVGSAFDFANGYQQTYRLFNGKGYWVKFPGAETDSVRGTERVRDSVSVVAGWNIVGSISRTIDTNTVASVPPGIKVSNWYAYSGGYVLATQIVPGKGYWVKVGAAGKFVLASSAVANHSSTETAEGDAATLLNALTITDNAGHAQTLYFGPIPDAPLTPSLYMMPPVPPTGAFDARFGNTEGGTMMVLHPVDGVQGAAYPVAIQADAYPLTVSWKVHHGTAIYAAADGADGARFRSRTLKGDGSFQIADETVKQFIVTIVDDGVIPAAFDLAQNYPNPFNPTTTIRYQLPIDSHVLLTLYDILGRAVASVVNENQKAGFKSVTLDARALASGTYFYRLQAGAFTSIRKLLILK